MTMRTLIIAALLIATTPALAQPTPPQPPDPAFMQRAINSVQAQRNRALDEAAALQAQVETVNEMLKQLQAKVRELEAAAKPKD